MLHFFSVGLKRALPKKPVFALVTALMTVGLSGCASLSVAPGAQVTRAVLPDIDRNGWLALVSEKSDAVMSLVVMRPDGSDRRDLALLEGSVFSPVWSPNGRYLAFSVQATQQPARLFIYDVQTNQMQPLPAVGESDYSPSFSADGSTLFFSAVQDGTANLLQMRLSDQAVGEVLSDLSVALQPSVSPDGRLLAFISDQHQSGRPGLYLMDLHTQESQPLLIDGLADSPSWHPEGRLIGLTYNRQAAIYDLNRNRLLPVAYTDISQPLRFSPSGMWVVYATDTGLAFRPTVGGEGYRVRARNNERIRAVAWGR